MSRSTQFIGLTASAQKFVADLKKVPSDKYAEGMFNEAIPLGRWEAPEGRWSKTAFIQEVVQESPWSSGPMIFTRLEIEFQQSKDQVFTASCFEWIHDPTFECEYNEENGSFWV